MSPWVPLGELIGLVSIETVTNCNEVDACMSASSEPLLINMTVTVWQLFPTQSHSQGFQGAHVASEWHVAAVRAALTERLSLEISLEAQSSMGPVTSFSGMICERWWELFPIPNSRRVKTSLDSADFDMIEKVVFTFMSRDQGWEENFEYASGHLIISMYPYGGQTPDAGSWTWFGAEIWRPVPTSRESDPRLRHRPLSNCTFQRMSVFQLLMCFWLSWPMSLPSYQMTVCRWIVSEVRQFYWMTQAFSDRASASTGRVIRTKPI